MRPGRLALGLLVAALLAAAAAAFAWYGDSERALGTAPERRVEAVALPERAGTVSLSLDVPFATIQQAVTAAVPAEIPLVGTGPERCLRVIGQQVCAGSEYVVRVLRAGNVALARAPDGRLAAAVPLAIDGVGGLTGDLARSLRLERKQFRAALIATANLAVDLGRDWCPSFAAEVSVAFTVPPRVELLPGSWLDIGPIIDRPLKAALERVPELVARALPCDLVRGQAERLWRPHAVPLQLPDAAPLFLNVEPRAIGFAGVAVGTDRITVAGRIEAVTRVAPTAVDATRATPLPPLERVPAAPGRIAVSVPVRVPYETIRAVLRRELQNRSFGADTFLGRFTVEPLDVALYPAGRALALAVSISGTAPFRLLDTSGTVTVTAVPTVADEGRRIVLADVGFARAIDSGAWRFVSAVLADQVRAAIARAGTIDLAPVTAQAMARLSAALADPGRTGGIALSLSEPRVLVRGVAPEENTLAVLIDAEAGVRATLERLPLPAR